METTQKIQRFVRPEEQGQYLTVPFHMPPEVERFTLRYRYVRHQDKPGSGFIAREEVNIIDLGLIAPDGGQVGVSGSDKTFIEVSETYATPGYHACRLSAGEWRILLGAYKVAPQGVTVDYELTFTPKRLRWLKGDLHTHTVGSDGVLTVQELGQHARAQGLDFLAITDHNQMARRAALPDIPGLTLIPGIEWTHFQGHANFIGVDQPYDGPFFTNDSEQVKSLFATARARGALVSINHPYEEVCPFQFDLESLPFDCIEIWNGPMRAANLAAVGLWHSMLAAGRKVPACGGSDYHRDHLFILVGGPTLCVRAASAGVSDILAAIRQGHSYLTFAPYGPLVEMNAGGAIMGDSVRFAEQQELQLQADGLQGGDIVQVTTAAGSTVLCKAEGNGTYRGSYTMPAPGFARVEILRSFIPGMGMQLPALITNPVYFDP